MYIQNMLNMFIVEVIKSYKKNSKLNSKNIELIT